MNAGPSSDFPQGNDLDPRHEAVWRLVGRAPMPEPDGWFAARTLARCRTEKAAAISLARIWRWALGGGLGICLAVSLLVAQVTQVPSDKVNPQKNVQEAFEIMASAEQLRCGFLRGSLHVMARLVPLTLRVFTAGLGCIVLSGAILRAQSIAQPPPAKGTNAPSAKPPVAAIAPAKPGPTNTAAALPPAMQNTLGRYGNIVQPGDVVAYPLKLKLPIPGDAEVRVPKADDLDKRQKLEALAKLSDDDIRKQLAQWPAYGKMNLHDQGMMLQRIQDFRDYHARIAMQKAHDMGLLTLTPEQKPKFEQEYWDKRLKLDEDLAKQFQPFYQAREQKMDDDLFREFSSTAPAPAPSPAKPGTPPAPKPPQPPAKPLATTAKPVATNAAPIAQAPH